MHWSRLVDMPLALMMLALKPFVGAAAAEATAITIWPILLLAPALLLVGRIGRTLAGNNGAVAALLLSAMSVPALVHYQPGSIDHHNLQILLTLAATHWAMRLESGWRNGFLAGLSAAASLAVGLEMLPALAAIGAAAAVMLVVRGAPMSRPALSFGLSLAGCTAALSVVLVPPGTYMRPVCDALGGPVLLLAAGAGLAMAAFALAAARLASPLARIAAGIACVAPVAGAVAYCFPDCLGAPYGMVDPLVQKLWLATVSETIPVGKALRTMPQESFAVFGFPILAMIGGALCLWRCEARLRLPFAVATAAILAHFCVSLWEIRGASAAALASAPVLAAALALALEARKVSTALRLTIAALVVSPISLLCAGGAFAAAFVPGAKEEVADGNAPASCPHIGDAVPLAALPAGRVMTFIDLGPSILAETAHTVYAAPFHRNSDGNSAMLKIMMGAPDAARAMLVAKKADYLAICPGAPEQYNIGKFAPDGLAMRLQRGERFGFLQPQALEGNGHIKVWKVVP